MCGIIGTVGGPAASETLRRAARDLLVHRGPDSAGEYADASVWLGSRRLAIQDLEPVSDQPWVDAQSGCVVAYNGEIFNYIELRRELEQRGHRFVSRGDTEVLLRAYLEWGPACAERFNGMWAFAIWDPREALVHLSRDRFGIKPLFHASVDGTLAFASEPKALLALFPGLREPDEVAIERLLSEKSIYDDPRSFYREVRALAPASWTTWSADGELVGRHRYWDAPPEATGQSWKQTVAEFDELFADAVALRLRSDVPLGLTLSGGLDSTAVLHAAVGVAKHPVGAYSSTYPDAASELGWAKTAVARYPNVELHPVAAAEDDWIAALRRIVWHMDGPGFSPAVFPLWNIMARARADGVKVLLEGQGADEILGGYSWHLSASLADRWLAPPSSPRQLARELRALANATRAVPHRRLGADLLAEVSPHYRAFERRRGNLRAGARAARPAGPRLASRLHEDFHARLLPAFLHYGDAVSMAHSVEARLPFLDHRLVEWAFRTPSAYKVRDGISKAPLRSYLERAGQQQIARRARKLGYTTPMHAWLARDGGAPLRELLLDPGARTAKYIPRRQLAHAIDRHVAGHHARGDSLFALVSTELWLEECIANPHAGGSGVPD